MEEAPAISRRLEQLLTLFAWALAIALAIHFFSATKLIFLGLLGAAVLAATLKPLAERFPAGRWFSASAVGLLPVVVVGGLLFLAGWLLRDIVQQELSRGPQIREEMNRTLHQWTEKLGVEREVTVERIGQRVLESLSGSGDGGEEALTVTAAWIGGLLIATVLVIFGAMFLLGEPRRKLVHGVAQYFPPRRREQLDATVRELEPRLRWWFIGQSISMTVTGLATWGGLALIGLPFALPLAIFAGFAEIVPNIGPSFAFLVVLLVAATQDGTMVLQALGVWAVVQTLESYVIVPLVMKRAVAIPPLITLFSVVLWGNVFGIPGLLLAIPIDLVLWSFGRHFLARPDMRAAPVPEPQG